MGEFFKGWRRKVGCILLIAATGVMGFWLRSRVVEDDMLLVTDLFPERPVESGGIAGVQIIPDSIVILKIDEISEDGVGANGQPSSATVELSSLYEIPFVSIVFPAVLLSAYLILWKPQKREKAQSPP